MDIESALTRAKENLILMSRTANGVIDVSASSGKERVMLVKSGSRTADLARNNFETAFLYAWDHRNDRLDSPEAVQSLIECFALIITRGILKEGCLYRQEDALCSGPPYISMAEVDDYRKTFYEELYRRLNDPLADPVEEAAYTEFQINVRGHFFADGCRKIGMVSSAYVLMRRGHDLPRYSGGIPAYMASVAGWNKKSLTKAEDEACYRSFLSYYRTLFV